jgi:preprotein translocase subunit SecB
MIFSPLQLAHYFALELQLKVNSSFDRQKESTWADNLHLATKCTRVEGKQRWMVTLTVECIANQGANDPYAFHVSVVGAFDLFCDPSQFPEAKLEVNAKSVLFSVVREIVRDLTSRGPYGAIMLPTLSFAASTPPASEAQK